VDADCRPFFLDTTKERYRVGVHGSFGTDCHNQNQPRRCEMFHRITLIGFVGQAPQMRYTEEGTPVTNFSVATRQVVSKERVAGCPTGWKESLNGKNWELTTWFRVTCWRKLAEAANEYLDKGQQVFVEAKPSLCLRF
jgi:hypothetical protein